MDSLSERMARTARDLQDDHDDAQATFQSAVEAALRSVEGCDAAGLSFVARKRPLETVAATDDMARVADHLQYELGEGPCLDAVWHQQVVLSRSLEHDERWPAWGPRVVEETSAQSIMSFRLFTNRERLGALNLYSRTPDAFDDSALDEGFAVAAHISIAVSASQEVDHLAQGLTSRTVIGQATGILMERYDLDSVRAFSVLTRMSSQGNVKLRKLSEEIVEHRSAGAATTSGGAPA